MPTYDYRCAANGRTIEVKHRISESFHTWAELCQVAGLDLGDTPAESPVQRLATGGQVVKSGSLKESTMPACGASGCGGGMCGMK